METIAKTCAVLVFCAAVIGGPAMAATTSVSVFTLLGTAGNVGVQTVQSLAAGKGLSGIHAPNLGTSVGDAAKKAATGAVESSAKKIVDNAKQDGQKIPSQLGDVAKEGAEHPACAGQFPGTPDWAKRAGSWPFKC